MKRASEHRSVRVRHGFLPRAASPSILAVLCLTATAQANPAAQALFEEGRRLVESGRHEEACPKFRESQAMDPGIGTLYNLAECLEVTGRTASAWAAFHEAADMARNAGQAERETAARARAVALEPRLIRLRVDVPPQARAAGLTIRRNNADVGQAQWGVDVPTDPGVHIVVAEAPGKVRRQWSVTLMGDGTTQVLHIEPLEAAPAPAPKAEPTVPVTSEPSDPDLSTWGWILGGAGVVGVGVGTAFALSARSKYDDSLAFCNDSDPNRCNATGVSLREDARGRGNVATVALGLGGAALIGGIVLVLASPDRPDEAARIETGPAVAGEGAAWMMRGTW